MVYQQHKIPWRLWYISHDISEVFICRCVNSYCFGMTKISPCFVLQLTWKISHGFFSSRCLRYLGVYLFTHSETCSLFWMLFCWTSALTMVYQQHKIPYIERLLWLRTLSRYYIHFMNFLSFCRSGPCYIWFIISGGKNAFIFHSWAHIGLGIPLKLFRWFSCLIMILLCLSPLPVCLKCAVKFLWTATEALNH